MRSRAGRAAARQGRRSNLSSAGQKQQRRTGNWKALHFKRARHQAWEQSWEQAVEIILAAPKTFRTPQQAAEARKGQETLPNGARSQSVKRALIRSEPEEGNCDLGEQARRAYARLQQRHARFVASCVLRAASCWSF